MMSRRTWVVALLIVPAAALAALYIVTNTTDRHEYQHRAIADASVLAWACRAYHDRSGGNYPDRLADLLTPKKGRPLVDDAERALTDPWGNAYRYAVVPNERGEPEPYVWAEQASGGRLTLLGAKVTAAGETVLFGLPE
jgi:hypothetical protein